jgi:hypothetical protein
MSKLAHAPRIASQTGPANTLKPVVPADDADLPDGLARSLYVAGAGTLVVRDSQGNQVMLVSGSGQYHPIRVKRVLATNTTANGIIALY